MGDTDAPADTRGAEVDLCGADHVRINVQAIERQFGRRLAGSLSLIDDACPQVFAEAGQVLKGKMALQAGGLIEGHHGRLQQDRAAAHHRVEQRRTGFPAGQAQHPGGEVLIDRRGGGLDTITAPVEWHAGQIKIEGVLLAIDIDEDGDIGLARVDAGPFASVFAEAVADAVLDPQGNEIEAFQRALVGHRVDNNRLVVGKPARPWKGQGGVVQVVLVLIDAAVDEPEDTDGEPTPQADLPGLRHGGLKVGAPASGFGMVTTQFHEFAGQFGLKSSRAGREKCEQLLLAFIALCFTF